MRKLVSLGAVLLFLVGIAVSSQPAGAAPPCSCDFCASRPNSSCFDDGFWIHCSDFTEFYCFGLNAPTEKKVASEPAKLGSEPVFFPLELLGVPAPETPLSPMLPVARPGC